MNEISTVPLNVTINQVSLGNKKLTKSIFNQIEFSDCFNAEIDFIGDSIIGYVKDKEFKYLLWTINGKLRKTRLNRYAELNDSAERASLEKTEWFLLKTKLKHYRSDDYRDRLSEGLEEHDKYKMLVKKAKDFLESLADKQIYL